MSLDQAKLVLVTLAVAVVTSYADVRNAALNGHNTYRRQEASQENVANMNALVWSSDLANRARQWAAKCRWGHQNINAQQGENLYYSYPKNAADDTYINRALSSWMSEKKFNTDKSFNCCNKNTACCHYTQVVSSKSKSVGCAVVKCDKLYNLQGSRVLANNAAYVACFYSPAGNVVMNGDPKPYKYGKRSYPKPSFNQTHIVHAARPA